MDYQVPSDSLVANIFSNATTRKFDYTETKETVRLQGIDLATVKNHKDHNKTLLHLAAGFGRKSWVRGLIHDGADVNAQDDEGQTPLHAACNHAHKTVAKMLLDAKADVNLTDNKGWSALRFTLSRLENATRVQPHYWEVVELLMNHGANPYLKSVSGKNSFASIRDAKQRLTVRIIHLLNVLENNCDHSSGLRREAEREAIIDKYLRVTDFFELVKAANEDFVGCFSTLDIIEQLLTPRLLRSRLESCDDITPLHRAAGYNHLEVAELFIRSGVDLNSPDRDGRIPLHNAAMYGHLEMIDLLVEAGSDVNRQDNRGYAPLHVAAESDMEGTFIACLRLISLGANKQIRSLACELPYDLAKTNEVRQVLTLDQLRMIPSTSEQAVYIGFQSEGSSTKLVEPTLEIQPKSLSLPASEPDDNLMLNSSSNERLFSNTQHEIKKVILSSSDPRYKLVEQRMLETIVNHANDNGGRFRNYEIQRIELILHQRVWSKYRLACQRLEIDYGAGSKNEKLLFHGSNFIDKIQAYGFDERYAQSKGMFGAGLYFAAHSSKSNQYAFGFGQGCEEHKDKSCYVCQRKMIYAQVALGRSLISKEAIPDISHAPPGYSSVTGLPGATDGLLYPEYVIYNGDQAYPLFVITYRINNDMSVP